VVKEAEVGLVIRWSEDAWRGMALPDGVRIIDLGSSDVVGTTNAIMSCRRIISSALHGLVIADAYGIPSAWLSSDSGAGGSRPSGGEFKFYDYMLSVQKVRNPQEFEPRRDFASLECMLERITFDDRPIEFDHAALLDASPFVARLDDVTD
jgi:pyruvyltransferase